MFKVIIGTAEFYLNNVDDVATLAKLCKSSIENRADYEDDNNMKSLASIPITMELR